MSIMPNERQILQTNLDMVRSENEILQATCLALKEQNNKLIKAIQNMIKDFDEETKKAKKAYDNHDPNNFGMRAFHNGREIAWERSTQKAKKVLKDNTKH
jgi:hypothetical protein